MKKINLDYRISLLIALVFFFLAVLLREQLTALMSLHMLVQIPLLVLSGVFAQQVYFYFKPRNSTNKKSWSYNEYGLPGLLLVSLIGAYWMIPKALDDALVDWRVALFKYAGLPLCGWLLRSSVRKSNVVIKVFFLGNFCWMSAIVGIVYLDQPIRLCNAYLQNDQEWAGIGLVALAIILPLAWLLAEIKPIWRFLSK